MLHRYFSGSAFNLYFPPCFSLNSLPLGFQNALSTSLLASYPSDMWHWSCSDRPPPFPSRLFFLVFINPVTQGKVWGSTSGFFFHSLTSNEPPRSLYSGQTHLWTLPLGSTFTGHLDYYTIRKTGLPVSYLLFFQNIHYHTAAQGTFLNLSSEHLHLACISSLSLEHRSSNI